MQEASARRPHRGRFFLATRKSRQGFPRRPAVALRLLGGLLRRAVLERSRAYLAMDARPQ
jgi:hypothetical protein